jgi:L-ascorbate metabolism protein UlaG (beta-lactamase superfamily)
MRRIVRVAAGLAGALAAGAVAERLLLAAPRYRGPMSDHFDRDRFHNLDDRRRGSFLEWQRTRQPGFWPEWIDAVPGPAPELRVDGGRVRITFINHATTLIQLDGVNILTDPIWGERTSAVSFAGPKRHRPPGIRFRDLPPIDAVLVSHNHYDHLDVGTLWRLRVRGASTRIVTPLGNGAVMARHGLTGVTELDWWNDVAISERVRVTQVPAQHFSSRGLSDRDRNLWGGFVIGGASGNVYFAGDTGWGSHFTRIAERFSPIRAALLPIGAYLPRWFMKPVHVDPAEAVEAHRVLGAGTSIAMHYGTFALGDDGERQPVDDLRRAVAAAGNPQFVVLEHGEGRDV